MRRNFEALGQGEFDLLIIGGGINGSCIARDAAMRGLSVALVEKRDFSSATSSRTSKLVHGGLRYLRNFELGLVRESLAERRIWQRIAPHQVRPLPFLFPLEKKSRATMNIGLTLYDWLSFDRNWLDDPAQKMPGHSWLSAEQARAAEPILAAQKMDGAFLFYDCQMRAPERLGLECLIDADRFGAKIVNYAEAKAFLREGRTILGAEVEDRMTGAQINVRAKVTMNAAGPWADELLALAEKGEPSRHLVRSKGIHFITRALTTRHAVTAGVPEEMGGGHLFLLPWRGHTIIGTTDTAFEGDPDEISVSKEEITSYLKVINKTIPGTELNREDIIHTYAGLRPLIQDKAEKENTYNASRKSEVVDHEKDEGLKGLFSAIGGKWTTGRHVAEIAVNKITKSLGKSLAPCATAVKPLPGGRINGLARFFEDSRARYPKLPQDNFMELVHTYGSEVGQLYDLIGEQPSLAQPLSPLPSPPRHEVAAQIVHAARSEMALTLEDAVFRRTGFGTLGDPGPEALAQAARLMGAELGWDQVKIDEELRAVRRLFYAL